MKHTLKRKKENAITSKQEDKEQTNEAYSAESRRGEETEEKEAKEMTSNESKEETCVPVDRVKRVTEWSQYDTTIGSEERKFTVNLSRRQADYVEAFVLLLRLGHIHIPQSGCDMNAGQEVGVWSRFLKERLSQTEDREIT